MGDDDVMDLVQELTETFEYADMLDYEPRPRDKIIADIRVKTDALRAQLLAARAEALEDAAKMVEDSDLRAAPMDMALIWVRQHLAAALRAKGGGK